VFAAPQRKLRERFACKASTPSRKDPGSFSGHALLALDVPPEAQESGGAELSGGAP
jgi:hypothetical protein